MDVARGLITFVIAVSTIAIALILVLTAILTRDFDKRIAVGKEVLTILVGVLGTIVGFYYGTAASGKSAAGQADSTSSSAQISFAQIRMPDQVKSGDSASVGFTLAGGTPPYRYSILILPDTVPIIKEMESAKGEVNHRFKVTAATGANIVPRIEGKDKNGLIFTFNKDLKQTIAVR